jgi:hypothetical protein
LIFNVALEYAIRKVHANQEEIELNGIHQPVVYDDDVNVLWENIDAIKRNTEILLEASRGAGLEVNTENTKYMVVSRHQNAGQDNLLIANKSFKSVAQLSI